ncbi:hypothetical protein QQP08_013077 [Theobroma cacao]|nr:hypothetical protein QQP08_013077 [Theobroma cacao]
MVQSQIKGLHLSTFSFAGDIQGRFFRGSGYRERVLDFYNLSGASNTIVMHRVNRGGCSKGETMHYEIP